ncbi:MAG: tetratricopeptide repeat protein, partial [Opitutae bacterium]|nr:tetratricopeptide repeat protein [Opitutae bacterium]
MPPFPASQVKLTAGLMVLLAALTLGLFWPAVGYDYINLDDPQYVFGNPRVLTGLTADNIRWAFTHVYEAWWLPALWISYMADATLLGPEPWGFHLVNILLHAANVLLLFWVLARLTGSKGRSFVAAALFALHPLRIESVAWITERKDVLSGFFFCLCLLTYIRMVERPGRARFWALHLVMLLGLMAKSILVVLPFLLLLLDYWPLRRAGDPGDRSSWPRWRALLAEKSILFGLSAIFIVLTLQTHGTIGEQGSSSASWWTRASLVAPNYGSYLAHIFWPTHLSILYPTDFPSLLLRLAAPLGLIGLSFLFWRLRVQDPALLVGWLWFLVALFPVIRGIRFDEQSAFSDRYTYLPSIGLSLMLVFAFSSWFSHQAKGRLLLWLLAVLALGACGTLTAYNLRFWRDSDTLAQRLWELDPGNPNAITARGNALQKQERWDDARDHFRKAVATSPLNARYRMLLALALVNMDRLPEAFAVLDEGLRAAPQEPELAYALGLAHLHGN